MVKSEIRGILKVVSETLRFAIIIPLAIWLAQLFAWCLGKASETPGDLEEQVRLANRKIEE